MNRRIFMRIIRDMPLLIANIIITRDVMTRPFNIR